MPNQLLQRRRVRRQAAIPPLLERFSVPRRDGIIRTSIPRRLPDPIDAFVSKFELPRIHYQPLDAINFDRDASLAVTASMAYAAIITVVIPLGYEGVLKWIGQGADAVGLFSDTTWQLTINGNPAMDWSAVVQQRGTIASPAPVTLFLPQGATVIWQIRNDSTNTYTSYGILRGWYWPLRQGRYATME